MPPPTGLSRRLVVGVALASFMTVCALSAWWFAWPSDAELREYAIGSVDGFALGSVTSYLLVDGELRELPGGEFYDQRPPSYPALGIDVVHVVRFPDSTVRVFSGAAPFRDSTILWYPFDDLGGMFGDEWVGLFAEGRRGSRWTIDGTRLFGPTPRGLDRYAYRVRSDGVLVIDLADLTEGSTSVERPRPYDVTSEDWPTSGWPSR